MIDLCDSVPGTDICTPGARLRMLQHRANVVTRKIQSSKNYISFLTDGGTHLEENQMSKKMRIYLHRSNNVAEFINFSTTPDDVVSINLLPYLHPCLKNDRLVRDMAIDFYRFMSNGTLPARLRLLEYLLSNVDDKRTTRLYSLQSIKFDGEECGIPITHVYSTREFHPGNVSRQDISQRTYARFDFIEAMYQLDDNRTMVAGNQTTLA